VEMNLNSEQRCSSEAARSLCSESRFELLGPHWSWYGMAVAAPGCETGDEQLDSCRRLTFCDTRNLSHQIGELDDVMQIKVIARRVHTTTHVRIPARELSIGCEKFTNCVALRSNHETMNE
jgi:hypothetical protein